MCFSLAWLEQILIWIVILACIIGVLQLLVPWVFSTMGIGLGPLPAIIRMIVIAIIVIAVIIFVFDLLGCLGGGFHLGRVGDMTHPLRELG